MKMLHHSVSDQGLDGFSGQSHGNDACRGALCSSATQRAPSIRALWLWLGFWGFPEGSHRVTLRATLKKA